VNPNDTRSVARTATRSLVKNAEVSGDDAGVLADDEQHVLPRDAPHRVISHSG
jgi:hypothetical protein